MAARWVVSVERNDVRAPVSFRLFFVSTVSLVVRKELTFVEKCDVLPEHRPEGAISSTVNQDLRAVGECNALRPHRDELNEAEHEIHQSPKVDLGSDLVSKS